MDMKEIRIHGRGGQGAVTLAELVALAAINEGKYEPLPKGASSRYSTLLYHNLSS